MEDYKKKYEEIIKSLKEAKKSMGGYTFSSVVDKIIPELKESEDDKVVNAIRKALESKIEDLGNGVTKTACLAWLEKQDKKLNIPQDTEDDLRRQSTIQILEYARSLDVYNQYGKESINKDIAWLEKRGKNEEIDEASYRTGIKRVLDNPESYGLKKQGEQKQNVIDIISDLENYFATTTKEQQEKDWEEIEAWEKKYFNHDRHIEITPTNKVEPKFKVGDWVTNGIDFTFQVCSVEDDMYLRSDEYFIDIETADKTFRLWTIKDTKDGDVLVSSSGKPFIFKGFFDNDPMAYGGLVADDSFWPASNSNWTTVYCKPATKEQRDLLFQKMKEAGYEWDAEKKELKKIEQKEDTELTDFESALFSAFSDAWQEYLNGEEVDVAKWTREHSAELLEVAREQNTAWSEEDEETLDYIIAYIENNKSKDTIYTKKTEVLEGMVAWLKSLKDRMKGK